MTEDLTPESLGDVLRRIAGELRNLVDDWSEEDRPGEPISSQAVLAGVGMLRELADEAGHAAVDHALLEEK